MSQVSNALRRSQNIAKKYFLLLIALAAEFNNLNIGCTVECFDLKTNWLGEIKLLEFK
jgi:hypothetical protein